MIGVTFPSAGGQSGSNYNVPEPGDVNTQSLTDYLVQVASQALALPVSADLDLGSAFGIKSIYFKTRTANPAATGILRLANADLIEWRNAANNADVGLGLDSGNNLLFAGANVTGNPMLSASTAAAQSIPNAAANTIVVFGTTVRDSDSAYNAGTGRYTVPAGKGGDYMVAATIAWSAAATTPVVQVFKNAALLAILSNQIAGTTTGTQGGSVIITMAAGDVLDIRIAHNSAGPVTLVASAAENFFTLKRIPT